MNRHSRARRAAAEAVGTGLLVFVGQPLWLESYAATALAALPVGLLVLRILAEERFLRRELPGYAAYAERVRYRLIPRLW